MKKFEYNEFNDVNTDGNLAMDELDRLGEKGWELVSVVRDSYGLRYFFKREKTNG